MTDRQEFLEAILVDLRQRYADLSRRASTWAKKSNTAQANTFGDRADGVLQAIEIVRRIKDQAAPTTPTDVPYSHVWPHP